MTMWDLRVAVGICRLSPFDSNVRKPWVVPLLLYASCILWSRRRINSAGKKTNALQRALVKRRDDFLAYANDYSQEPEYAIIPPPRGRGQVQESPRQKFNDVIEHAGELITWGIPDVRAWGMPLGMANVYRIIARRAAGNDIDITTEEEKKFRENVPDNFRVVRK